MNAPLVELVEDDGHEIRQQRVVLEARRENAFGDDEQLRFARRPPFESNLPADLFADAPALLFCDTPGDGARRDSPRLQQDDGTAIDQRRRNARRLAGAGGRRNHDGAVRGEMAVQRGDVVVDWKRLRYARHGRVSSWQASVLRAIGPIHGHAHGRPLPHRARAVNRQGHPPRHFAAGIETAP